MLALAIIRALAARPAGCKSFVGSNLLAEVRIEHFKDVWFLCECFVGEADIHILLALGRKLNKKKGEDREERKKKLRRMITIKNSI